MPLRKCALGMNTTNLIPGEMKNNCPLLPFQIEMIPLFIITDLSRAATASKETEQDRCSYMSYCAASPAPLIHAWAHPLEARYTPEPPFPGEAGLVPGRFVLDPMFLQLDSGPAEKSRGDSWSRSRLEALPV